ncbi:hypothetical protein OOU_Y34scaffold00777g25 [Pyricularia oryzae Y34]|uniref:SGNH hydrolase-type esterase domain-containing protein n=1 Tax=Pyricularia oryzae (strain Y34) TaxID=1143189 RepID=A0AA97PH12_PYRO3|nr:hypothetical protein OOU_Y34scaffold00777g25 [Pyricularia oryzae Y34]
MHLQTLLLGLLTAAPALSASCPAKPPPAFANGALLRIMPLGDSITRGVGATSSNGYRKRLVSELEKLANVSMGYAFMADRWVEAIKAAETLGLIKQPDEI